MSDGTKIEWADATANVISGCTLVSPGCANCYAMKQAHRFPVRRGLTRQSPSGMTWTGEVRFHEPALLQVLRWARPRRIFWNAHGDPFHPAVPDEWIDRCFAAMALTPRHTHQVLTKRPERMRDYIGSAAARVYELVCDMAVNGQANAVLVAPGIDTSLAPAGERVFLGMWPLENVWLGTSVEDQQRANERIPVLLDTPAAVRWISAEPLLGPVDLTSVKAPRDEHEPAEDLELDWRFDALTTGDYYWFEGEDGQPGDSSDGPYREERIDWVVAGGESGPGARPMHPEWARDLREQCAGAHLGGDPAPVPFLFKQWGNWAPLEGQRRTDHMLTCDGGVMEHVGKRAAGRLLDGVQHDGYPA